MGQTGNHGNAETSATIALPPGHIMKGSQTYTTAAQHESNYRPSLAVPHNLHNASPHVRTIAPSALARLLLLYAKH